MSATHSLVSRESTSPLEVGSRLQGIEGRRVLAVYPCAALNAPAPAARPTPLVTLDHDVCGCPICVRPATTVLIYRDGDGAAHSHLCDQHAAHDREWCDVVSSTPMPCSLPHDLGPLRMGRPQRLT